MAGISIFGEAPVRLQYPNFPARVADLTTRETWDARRSHIEGSHRGHRGDPRDRRRVSRERVLAPLTLALFIIAIVWPLQRGLQSRCRRCSRLRSP